MISVTRRRAVALALIVLAIMAVLAGMVATPAALPPNDLKSAPTELAAPALPPSELGQWCVDRKAAGVQGLSLTARQWLKDCIALFGRGLPPSSPSASPTATPSPTGSPTPTPSPTVSPTASPSPSPTPTSTPTGPLLGCATDPGRCGYPTTATTGVPASVTLTPYTGPDTIRVAGTVLDGKIMGCIAIEAANVVIRNSLIVGPCFYGVDMRSGSAVIEDTEVNCTDKRGTGIAWDHFTARRVYVHDCENALEMGEGASVVDSVLSAAEATSEGHGDGIQSQGGNGVVIRHNTLLETNPVTSAIITNPNLNNGWLVEDNLMGGGAYTLYCPENGTGFTVRNNRFVAVHASPYGAAYGLTDACGHAGIAWSGNIRDDTGAPVNPE